MPTDKIGDVPRACRDDDHEPRGVYYPGVYRHVCRACKRVSEFRVEDGETLRFPTPQERRAQEIADAMERVVKRSKAHSGR